MFLPFRLLIIVLQKQLEEKVLFHTDLHRIVAHNGLWCSYLRELSFFEKRLISIF